VTTFGPIPDGTGWIDAYGRPWTSHGDGLALWEIPTITVLGDDPDRVPQFIAYTDLGATASDAEGADLTASIVVDVSQVDVNIPGSYTVTYDVTDSLGYTDHAEREVVVVDVYRPDVRDIIYDLISGIGAEGLQVYRTPVPQLKAPAVVVGSMNWEPDRMNSLVFVLWDIDIQLVVSRSSPEYFGTYTLETLSRKVAALLIEADFRIVGFTDDGMSSIGGTDYLTGTLSATFRQSEEHQ